MKNFFKGKRLGVDIYLEEIDHKNLPSAQSNDEEFHQFLYKIFEEKDKLIDDYHKYHCFPHEFKLTKKRSLYKLIRFIFLNVFIAGGLLSWIIYLAIINESLLLRSVIYTLIAATYICIFVTLRNMQISNYGGGKMKNK
ncbi:hypothetical protein SSS_04377 [Sarcoptes scabiei]|nr:hypothetical protein SSS_04377 [Sarcoptes scabiei]